MKLFIEIPIGESSGLVEVDVLPEHTIGEIKAVVCQQLGIDPNTVVLVYGGTILNEGMTVAQLAIPEYARLALMPTYLIGGIDIARLLEEYELVRRQFPLVRALNYPPTMYEGMIKCEDKDIVELANRGIWPFTQYVQWHRFLIELPTKETYKKYPHLRKKYPQEPEYPFAPPVVTWLTEIDHPNIVPNVPGGVCHSILGEGWRPYFRLTTVINALYHLLADPNPLDIFDHPRCRKAAEICLKYGFPRKRKIVKEGELKDIIELEVVEKPEDLGIRVRVLRWDKRTQ